MVGRVVCSDWVTHWFAGCWVDWLTGCGGDVLLLSLGHGGGGFAGFACAYGEVLDATDWAEDVVVDAYVCEVDVAGVGCDEGEGCNFTDDEFDAWCGVGVYAVGCLLNVDSRCRNELKEASIDREVRVTWIEDDRFASTGQRSGVAIH